MTAVHSTVTLDVRHVPGALVETYRYTVGAIAPLRRHAHEDWQFGWSPDADGEHWVRGAIRPMPRGSLSVIPPGEVHAPSDTPYVTAASTYRMAYVNDDALRRTLAELTPASRTAPTIESFVIGHDQALARMFARAHRASFADDALHRDEAWLGFLVTLLSRHGGASLPRIRRRHPHGEPRAVRIAIDLLSAHPGARVTLAQLSAVTGLPPARLCRVFARHVGVPPHAYQLGLRIERAKRWLTRGRPLAEIAAASGFADQSHFARHFKPFVGTTPSRYAAAVD